MMAGVHGELGDEQLRSILRQARRIAVVGLSPRPTRPSHEVAAYLKQHGYQIFPVNPTQSGSTILDEPVYASLAELPAPPDIIDVFRRSEYVPEVVEATVSARAALKPDANVNMRGALWLLWTQLGVVHERAATHANAAGLAVVQNRCLAVEHKRLLAAPAEHAPQQAYARTHRFWLVPRRFTAPRRKRAVESESRREAKS